MQQLLRLLSFAFLPTLLFACYLPGLYGDFEFDDQVNLLQNTDVQINEVSLHTLKLAALSGDSGPLGRPISMVTFALDHAATGFDPFYLKLTNVAIHTFSGAALYFLIVQLLIPLQRSCKLQLSDSKIRWIALLASAAWMMHPLNITSILYIVQRMTSLSGLFSIISIFFYAFGRNRTLDGKPFGWAAVLLACPITGVVALFCKENAAVLPLLIFLVEYFFFQFQTTRPRDRWLLSAIFTLTLWLPLIAATAYLALNLDWLLSGFDARGFTIAERLMTESRVIWMYIRMILAPDITLMGIYHDDIAISTAWLTPPSTLAASLGLALLGLVAITLRHRAPILAFGIAWFFAGHIMESSFIPLEIAHEHRNYLPMIGPILAVVYYLLNSLATAKIRSMAYTMTVLLIGILAFSTHVRARQWGDLLEHAIVEAENHPGSPRAQQQLGRLYFKLYKAERRDEFYLKALKAFETSSSLDQNFKSGLYARIILDYNAHRTPPEQVLSDFRYRLQFRRKEPGDITMFDSLLKCQLSGDCKLPDKVFVDLLEIEVERYKNDPERQASFLSFLGAYAAQKMDDQALAGKYLKQAIEIYPADVQGLLNYAWYLIVIGQYKAAEAPLAAAREADNKLNKFGQRIDLVEKGMQERKHSQKATK